MISSRNYLLGAVLAGLLIPGVASAANVNFDTGTQITGVVQQKIDTKNAYDGEKFTVVTQNGSTIYGHISDVVKSGLLKKAHLTLNVDSIQFADGTTAPLSAKVVNVQEKHNINVLPAAGEVVAGNVAGNYLGKHLIGGSLGGIIGLAGGALYAANTARDIQVPQNAQITVELTQPLIARPQTQSNR
ncbi:MAG TPA: hypothetical protein VGZ00_01420 [Candidatus Baltobacteraceae bacterium]|jgi:hypothetical protein|nr:hypothetical protein [Candidatus Baltobacteraceae bacterium]